MEFFYAPAHSKTIAEDFWNTSEDFYNSIEESIYPPKE